ncbi:MULTISPECIES: hypothetical protein [unclassified Luteimonas]
MMMTKQGGFGTGGDAPVKQPTPPGGAQKTQPVRPAQAQPQHKTKPGGPEKI